jgi:hypothetical protein
MKHFSAMLGVGFHCSSNGATPGTSDGMQTISMRAVQTVSFSTYPIRNEH